MWCMCGGCSNCNPVDLDAVRAEIGEEAVAASSAAVDQWLNFDSLCQTFGERALGSAVQAGADAERYVYGQHGLHFGER